MRCPICNADTYFTGNPYRPFCSERCKLIDLANWLEGRYKVPGNDGGGRRFENPSEEKPDHPVG